MFPSFEEDALVGAAIEPGGWEDRVGEFTPDLIDALASNCFEDSWAGMEPRGDRTFVLGFSETVLGLCARELARSLATSRGEGLEFVLVVDLRAKGAGVALGLLAVLRAELTGEGFLLVWRGLDLCERVLGLADFDSTETSFAVFGGVSRNGGVVSTGVADVSVVGCSDSPLLPSTCSG